jgi:hypothetical protein
MIATTENVATSTGRKPALLQSFHKEKGPSRFGKGLRFEASQVERGQLAEEPIDFGQDLGEVESVVTGLAGVDQGRTRPF